MKYPIESKLYLADSGGLVRKVVVKMHGTNNNHYVEYADMPGFYGIWVKGRYLFRVKFMASLSMLWQ